MRVSFFNEIDCLAMEAALDSTKLIQGISAGSRIGSKHNNPSFAYGGYCLPKDVKQLNSIIKTVGLKSSLISSITASNLNRLEYVCQKIVDMKKNKIGIFRLEMKKNSDNFRGSSALKILEILVSRGLDEIVHEPILNDDDNLNNFKVESDFEKFAQKIDLIVCNRWDDILMPFRHKIFTRDIYNEN